MTRAKLLLTGAPGTVKTTALRALAGLHADRRLAGLHLADLVDTMANGEGPRGDHGGDHGASGGLLGAE